MADTYLDRLRYVSVPAREQGIAYELDVWSYRLALLPMLAMALYAHAKQAWRKSVGLPPPPVNFWLGDGMSESGAKIRDNAALSTALDVIYNYDFEHPRGETAVRRWMDAFWMNIRNAQAVRNRLKVAKQQLRLAMRDVANRGEQVRVLSLAAGSAQAVTEVAAELIRSGTDVHLFLIDLDPKALRLSRDLADRQAINDHVTIKEGNVFRFSGYPEVREFRPNVVDVMGFVDYLTDKQALFLFQQVAKALPDGGHLLTCHIHPNAESYFLQHIINWKMRYRTRDQLRDLLAEAGFADAKLHTEPHGIHSVAVAQKIG